MRPTLPVLIAGLLLLCGCGSAATETSTSTSKPTARPAAPAYTTAVGKKIPATPIPGLAGDLVVGLGDQHPEVFAAPAFTALRITRARLVASYDTVDVSFDRELADAWLAAAKTAGMEPLVAFGHSRVDGRQRHLPSVAEYRRQFRAFRTRYPQVKLYTAWNEPNHDSQPTFRHPERAAAFADVVADECPDCTLVAGDVLDQAGVTAWLTRYRRALKTEPEVWGVHSYSDANRFRDRGLKRLLDALPGELWLTETGGLAAFGGSFPYDLTRQARATNYLFVLARSSPRIRRVYLYNWTGLPEGTAFDAGLTNPDGSARPAYTAVKAALGR